MRWLCVYRLVAQLMLLQAGWRGKLSALSAWDALVRRLRSAPRPLGWRFSTTTATACTLILKPIAKPDMSPRSTRCCAGIDIVSVNCPHTPATYHLLSRRRLAHLPPGALVVNTSRGEVIDEEALADALAEGRLGGAAFDVLEREPAVNARLLDFDNVILLPHMSSATIEGRRGMGEKVIINIRHGQMGIARRIWCCPARHWLIKPDCHYSGFRDPMPAALCAPAWTARQRPANARPDCRPRR